MNLNGSVTKNTFITIGQYKHLVNCDFVKQSTFYSSAKLGFIGIADDKIIQHSYIAASIEFHANMITLY